MISGSNRVGFGKLLLCGAVACLGIALERELRGQEDPPSILLPAPAEMESEEEKDLSISSTSESPAPLKRPASLSESPQQRLVNPQQLIYERAVRQARAREARLESRRWQGVSSSRPSAWNPAYGYYGRSWWDPRFVTHNPYGYLGYSPAYPVYAPFTTWGL